MGEGGSRVSERAASVDGSLGEHAAGQWALPLCGICLGDLPYIANSRMMTHMALPGFGAAGGSGNAD